MDEKTQPEEPRRSPWKITRRGCAAVMAALLLGWLMKWPVVTLIRTIQNKEIDPTANAAGSSLTPFQKHFCDPYILLPSILTTQLGLFIIAWWNLRRASRKGKASPTRALPHLWGEGREGGRPMKAILAGLAGALLLFAIAFLNGYVMRLVSGGSPPKPWKAVQEYVLWAKVSLVLLGIVVSPIVEELFFRGYLFGSFRREGHIAFGMVMSALLFAAIHYHNPYKLGAFFGFGLVFAWLYHRTGSLLSCITAHAANNALVFLWLLGGKC